VVDVYSLLSAERRYQDRITALPLAGEAKRKGVPAKEGK
jgi:hypothetical protein